MSAPRHVYQIHIRATAEEVWQALTDPAFTGSTSIAPPSRARSRPAARGG